jgi:hypothetical protein
MGHFQRGQKKPLGSGRKRGTPNKKTQHLSEALDSLGLNVPERLIQLLPQLSSERQVDVLLEILGYLYPRRKALEVSAERVNDVGPQVIVSLPSNGREVR